MNVLLVTGDLLASSQFEGAVRAVGAKLVVSPSQRAVAAARAAQPALVAIDLASAGDLEALVAGLKELDPAPAIVAYGPHVQEARLQEAADAGCDEVLTRGQFHREASDLLSRYVASR